MRYGQIRKYDIANGPGIRTSIFVTGCHINCPNCFNKDYQDPNFGRQWTEDTTSDVISYLKQDEVSGLTILGGEPFEHAEELAAILDEINRETTKSIWIYSGYTYEYLIKDSKAYHLLEKIDVLVDGPFIENLKNLNLTYRGSSNQRIIDVKKTLQTKEMVLLDGYL